MEWKDVVFVIDGKIIEGIKSFEYIKDRPKERVEIDKPKLSSK